MLLEGIPAEPSTEEEGERKGSKGKKTRGDKMKQKKREKERERNFCPSSRDVRSVKYNKTRLLRESVMIPES